MLCRQTSGLAVQPSIPRERQQPKGHAFLPRPKLGDYTGRFQIFPASLALLGPLLRGERWIRTHLPEPRALEKEGAGPEGLQDDVISEEHL